MGCIEEGCEDLPAVLRGLVVPIEPVVRGRRVISRVQIVESHDLLRRAPFVEVLAEKGHAIGNGEPTKLHFGWPLQVARRWQVKDLWEIDPYAVQRLTEGFAVR